MTTDSHQSKSGRRRRLTVVGVAAVVVLLIAVVVLTPRLLRLRKLWRLSDAFADRICAPELEFALPDDPHGEEFATGYSRFVVPSTPENRTLAVRTVIVLRNDDFNCILLPPYLDGSEQVDTEIDVRSALQAAVESGDETALQNDISTYAANATALRTTMPSAWETVRMDSDEFDLRFGLLSMKVLQPIDFGYSIFETAHIQGILTRGSEREPESFHLTVWDKSTSLTQGIVISSGTPEQSLETARVVAATYRFTIDELPPRDSLSGLIEANIEPTEVTD